MQTMKDAWIGKGKDADYTYSLEILKKHLFCFGSSGSGKTVLSKVFIEEAALQGIPSLIIDSQGDLASLMIQGDKDDLKEHNIPEDVLEKWSQKVKVTVFTPISRKGIPMCLNPLSLDYGKVRSEEVLSILNQMAESISKLLGYRVSNDKGKFASAVLFTILKHHYDEQRQIGSFKNLEQILSDIKDGLSTDVKLTKEIADIMENEQEIDLLLRKVRYLSVGEKELLFQFGVPLNIDMLMQKGQINVIYLNTLSNHDDKEFFLTVVCTKLYQWMLKHPKDTLQSLFYVDEAAPYIPAGSEKPMPKPMLMLLLKQARKYGIGIMLSTQNPGDIDYRAFSQFGTWAIGRLTVKQDIKKIENALKDQNITGERLARLKPGHFLMFCPDKSPDIEELKVRWLYTQHTTLTEMQIDELITDEQREQFNKFMIEPVSQEPLLPTAKDETEDAPEVRVNEEETRKSPLHFPLKLAEDEVPGFLEKHKKRVSLFGKKEQVAHHKLKSEPVFRFAVSYKKGLLKQDTFISTMLMSATDGSFLRLKRDFTWYPGFGPLVDLPDPALQVARLLLKDGQPIPSAEIALRLGFTNTQINAALKKLHKKHVVSFTKEGKHNLWVAIMPKQHITTRREDVLSDMPVLSDKYIQADFAKPKLTIARAEQLIRSWFPKTTPIHHETIYLPYYEIEYVSKRGTRRVLINAFTRNIMDRELH